MKLHRSSKNLHIKNFLQTTKKEIKILFLYSISSTLTQNSFNNIAKIIR
jgi:hypothetical protein